MNTFSGYNLTVEAMVASLCWGIVSAGFGAGAFSKRIRDTVLERFGLCGVSMAAAGAAWRIARSGSIAETGMYLSVAIAFWVVVVSIKMLRHEPRPTKDQSSEPTTLY